MREIVTLIRNCGGYVYSRGESIILSRGKTYLAGKADLKSKDDESTGSPRRLGEEAISGVFHRIRVLEDWWKGRALWLRRKFF